MKHLFYYIGLIAAVIVAVFAVVDYPQKQTQMMIVVAFGMFYAGWGILHHQLHHSLRPKIVLEYVAVSSLGIVAILFILRSVL